jgi:hypothetical protein
MFRANTGLVVSIFMKKQTYLIDRSVTPGLGRSTIRLGAIDHDEGDETIMNPDDGPS